MQSPALQVQVRPVERGEVPEVIEFLRGGFQNLARRSPNDLRPLFEYRWSNVSEKPSLGFALWSGQEIVGFLGVVYAERPLAGRLVKTCNLSTWYVRQDFRGSAMKLLSAALAEREYSVTNLTASPEVRRIMEALRFQTIDQCKWVYLLWRYWRTMLRPGPEVMSSPEQIAEVLQGDDRQLLRDHLPYRLKHYLLRSGSDYSYLVLKRRRFPGEVAFNRIPLKKVRLLWYPCMEVLHLGNLQLALRHWEHLMGTILRRERVLAVVVAERFLGATPPAGIRMEHRNYLLAREPLNATIDSLYSELAIYPL